ncbi:MAG: UbiD family decarboxylase [Alicyclobacillus sp.]|nr:UbiD family decarboxylase [Alicyclobacillus sp.]
MVTTHENPNLRTFLRQLEEAGELQYVDKPVDPLRNMGALAWQGENFLGKATFFNNLEGFPGWKACTYIETSRRRLALTIGSTVKDFIPRMRELLKQGPTPGVLVNTGPVKEVILKGDEVDLTKLPIHIMYNEDGGPYIGGGMGIVKDPDTGIQNSALHRHQIFNRNQMGIFMVPNRHTDLVYQKYEAKNEPCPIAIVIGHHPMLLMTSCWTFPKDVYEIDMAGTFLGEPIREVMCETVDLRVPADAEIVIEGYIVPNERKLEGPFTEHTGYARAGSGMNPYIEVTCITHRRDAIYHALQGGKPIASSQILDAIPQEIVLWERIKDVGGFVDLKDVVSLPYAGGSHIVVVQFTPRIDGEAKDVLLAALSSPYIHPKIAIAVDDDIDPHDPKEIFWSISTRVDPQRDVFIIPGTHGHNLDASLELITPEGVHPQVRRGSKMGIDATKPPLRDAKAREFFIRSVPKGWGEVDIRDYVRKV